MSAGPGSAENTGFFRCEARAAPTPTCTAGAGGPTWRPRWESRVRTGRSLLPKPRPATLPDPPLPSFSLSHWSTARISATPPGRGHKSRRLVLGASLGTWRLLLWYQLAATWLLPARVARFLCLPPTSSPTTFCPAPAAMCRTLTGFPTTCLERSV